MNKYKLRNLIILLIIILIMLMILASVTKNKNNVKHENNNINVQVESKIEEVDSYEQYYTVTNIIATYYGYVAQKNEEAVSNIMYEGEVETETLKNEFEKLNSEEPAFYTNKMYKKAQGKNDIYYVYGKIKDYLDSEDSKEVFLKIYIDNSKKIFAISPLTQKKYDNEVKEKGNKEVINIEENKYNKFTYVQISDMTKAITIFNDYSETMKDDPRKAYNMLNEEYREKKFGNFEEYIKYIENRENNFILSEYSVNEKGDYIDYSCIDQNGNKYFFREKSVMNYEVMLDNYVINTEEFVSKYVETTVQGKVILNIDKLFKAINDKSYYYVYNFFATEFKNRYFKSLDDFERYTTENFFENNRIEYKNFEEQNGLYIYTIEIYNENNEEESIEKTIIMKLNEGTDFEMSFNVN